jgi:hypothetical protein
MEASMFALHPDGDLGNKLLATSSATVAVAEGQILAADAAADMSQVIDLDG